jgi:uncharacterized membrane protein (DUF2068 family)
MSGAKDSQRSRRVLKLIALERAVRGLLLVSAGIYLLAHLSSDYGRLAERLMRTVELDPKQHFLHRLVLRLHNLRAHELRLVGALAAGYGLLELVEGTGLWLDQLWAEYLTVIATSLLVPFEIYELAHKPNAWKAAGLAVNIAIVAYLIRLLRRRLATLAEESNPRRAWPVTTPAKKTVRAPTW